MTKDNNSIVDEVLSGEVEFIPPSKELKKKAGSGGIPDHLIERGDTFIKENKVDFSPYGRQHIENIQRCLAEIKVTEDKEKLEKIRLEMRQEIMKLKAHGKMFNYDMITTISSYVLKVLENSEDLNDDLYKIIEAHNNSVSIILDGQLKSEKDIRALALLDELKKVIGRYQKKYKVKIL